MIPKIIIITTFNSSYNNSKYKIRCIHQINNQNRLVKTNLCFFNSNNSSYSSKCSHLRTINKIIIKILIITIIFSNH